jgi:hypothetical protein
MDVTMIVMPNFFVQGNIHYDCPCPFRAAVFNEDSVTQGVALGCYASALQAGFQTASILQVQQYK